MCVLKAKAILVFRGFSPSSSSLQRQEGLLGEYRQYCSSDVFLILVLLELVRLPKQQSLVMMVGCFLLPFAPLPFFPSPLTPAGGFAVLLL